jgi:hypothetical protein
MGMGTEGALVQVHRSREIPAIDPESANSFAMCATGLVFLRSQKETQKEMQVSTTTGLSMSNQLNQQQVARST